MREQVKSFSKDMERVLKKNDEKHGWDNLTIHWLLYRLKEETDELRMELTNQDKASAMREAIDVANFAMMIWDNLRRGGKK